MAFVGLEKVKISTYISHRVKHLLTIPGILIIVITCLALLYVLRMVKALDENVKAVRQMSTGDLAITLSDKVKNRSDEFGGSSGKRQ